MQPPQTTVCVLTARGMAAISSVALTGEGARDILKKVFRTQKYSTPSPLQPPPPSGVLPLRRGRAFGPSKGGELNVLHGSIVDGERVIDEVVVGCEGHDCFVIHCHGNPLLVEQIVKLLQSHGAVLTDADSAALTRYQADSKNIIEAEAKLAMQKSTTLWGVKILRAQIDGGLSKWAEETLEAIDSLDVNDLQRQCSEILNRSRIGRYVIEGVRIVIAGPPNSGKSTLLNRLAGQTQAVVSDTAGTTRDWVSITCLLGNDESNIRAEIFDTAGLDQVLAGKDSIEQAAQVITQELLDGCDLILYVQDTTDVRTQNPEPRIDSDKPVIYVNNKCDLLQELKNPRTQELRPQVSGREPIFISAKENAGIDCLVREILGRLELITIKSSLPIVFTRRQRDLFTELLTSRRRPDSVLQRLLHEQTTAVQ